MFLVKKSRPRFQGQKHINLYLWCYTTSFNSDGSLASGSYPSFYTLTQLQALKTMGFDSVRLCVRGDPLVVAQKNGQTATFAALVGQIITAAQLCVAAGLLVNVDAFHLASAASSPVAGNVLASNSTSAPWFLAYVAALAGVATQVAAYFLPEQVALDLINEPNPPTNYWASTLQPVAFAAARAAAPQLTLIVTGEGGTAANLSNLTVANYDWNTLYNVHCYDWVDFTYAGPAGQGEPIKYYGAVDYPPDGLSAATAIAQATTNINADGTLTSGQKTSTIVDATTRLTNYYANFTRAGLLNSDLPVISAWADAHGVDRSQIYIGEMGAAQSLIAPSNSPTAVAAWYADVAGWFTRHNMRWGPFCADIPSWATLSTAAMFFLQSPSSGAGTVCNSSNVPSATKTALGLV